MTQDEGSNPYFVSNTKKELMMKKTILMMILTALPLVGHLIAEQPSVAGSSNDPYVMKVYPDGTKVIVRWSDIGKSVDNGEKHGGAPRIVAYDPGKDGIVPIGTQEAASSGSTGGSSITAKDSMPPSQGNGINGDLSGFYMTPTVGVAVVQDIKLRANSWTDILGLDATGNLSVTANPGIRFDLPFGCNVNEWFSFEFAPGVIWNSFQALNAEGTITDGAGININGNGSLTLGGNFVQIPIMANFIFKIPTDTKWTPYFGGGIGGNYNYVTVTSVSGIPEPSAIKDNCWSMGYQGIAGFDYECTKEISLGLRYIFTGSTQQVFQGDLAGFSTQGSFTHTVNLTCTARF
jgi:opacity protein-like surface antigen